METALQDVLMGYVRWEHSSNRKRNPIPYRITTLLALATTPSKMWKILGRITMELSRNRLPNNTQEFLDLDLACCTIYDIKIREKMRLLLLMY